MSDFAGMEDLLEDFLVEAEELLSGVDNKLVDLERTPEDRGLLNEIFRGFHTIKGGAGFLNAAELVTLCHLTENMFDKLRNGELAITPEIMDIIMDATAGVRSMFGFLHQKVLPPPADANLIARLKQALEGKPIVSTDAQTQAETDASANVASGKEGSSPDWEVLYDAVTDGQSSARGDAQKGKGGDNKEKTGAAVVAVKEPAKPRPAQHPVATVGRKDSDRQRETSIRVDTARLDQVLNLSGEIGLTKNRLGALRSEIISGQYDSETLHAMDIAVSQLDLLVSDLQNAVMKTRMQPIGRLFQKYPRIARDLARGLGKDVELVLDGEETEIDKTMIEDLSDPIIHLIRNAVDHGIELPEERLNNGKPAKAMVQLSARQEGDHILITVADDGRGMDAEKLRSKAVERGLLSEEEANGMDEHQSFNLVFLPGFSMAKQVSDVSGRGVGMDVVRTNIQKLNGTIDIRSRLGKGTSIVIGLPLTLAILPVLLVRLGEQPFAVPLSMVREILPVDVDQIKEVGGRATMVIRGEVLPIMPLAHLLGWELESTPSYGVLMQVAEQSFILGIDSFAGREDAVIKSLDDFRPKGVAGVTILANGQIVLILDMKELLKPGSSVNDYLGVTHKMLVRQRQKQEKAAGDKQKSKPEHTGKPKEDTVRVGAVINN